MTGCGEKEVLWAAENGDMPVLRKLLLSDPELVNVHDKDGYTPLHRACYSKHHDAAEVLNAHSPRQPFKCKRSLSIVNQSIENIGKLTLTDNYIHTFRHIHVTCIGLCVDRYE